MTTNYITSNLYQTFTKLTWIMFQCQLQALVYGMYNTRLNFDVIILNYQGYNDHCIYLSMMYIWTYKKRLLVSEIENYTWTLSTILNMKLNFLLRKTYHNILLLDKSTYCRNKQSVVIMCLLNGYTNTEMRLLFQTSHTTSCKEL